MSTDDDRFFQRLLQAFQIEAAEHLQAISSGLLALEESPDEGKKKQIVDTVYREAHSLKGAARAVDIRQVEGICQALESIFAAWRKKELAPAVEQFDTLHRAVAIITEVLANPANAPAGRVADLVREIDSLRPQKGTADRPPVKPVHPPERPTLGPVMPPDFQSAISPPPKAPLQPQRPSEPLALQPLPSPSAGSISAPETKQAPEAPAPLRPEATEAPQAATAPVPVEPQVVRPNVSTIRIAAAKLDSVLLQAEEMLTAKITTAQRLSELRSLRIEAGRARADWNRLEQEIRPWLATHRSAPLEAALEASANSVRSLENRIQALESSADRDRRTIGAMVDTLLEDAKQLVMLPVESLLEGFPRLVRELARDQKKEIHLVLKGHEVEIDKRIIEEIKDPLIHILRNCVDHGIEPPAQRGAKPQRATISLDVTHTAGNKVSIVINDDGRGIDVSSVKNAAVKSGKITAEQARRLSDDQARQLIFHSDVSTSRMITEISGRGMGLSIARQKVQKLGGRILVSSKPGVGTKFEISLPVTLATMRGVFVRAGERLFVIPVTQIERVARIGVHEVRSVGGQETISIDQRVTPLVRIEDVLKLPRISKAWQEVGDGRASSRFTVLILSSTEHRIAFRIDEIAGEQEVLVKPLGRPLLKVRNIAGATILADGRPVPLLDVPDLLRSASTLSGRGGQAEVHAERPADTISVVLAEDSITSRMLLKNILESAGYPVTTAVDGADALATLRTGDYQLLVSDVDMPRMNGFELTAAVRADPRLSKLPVVLVTARSTQEDREKGIDVGANAYIVKSSFDQSDLLSAIKRLV